MSYTPQFQKEYENGWVDFPSEETLVTAHALDMYDETFEHIEEYLEDNPFIQTATMPTASEDELGHIYQYMGETTATFTQGYFYKCVSDEEEEPTYSWQNISVQSGGGGGSDVSITPTLSTGTKIADFEIDGVGGELYAPTGGGGGTNAQWTQTQTNGTKIAEIEIDDVSQDVFDSTWSGTHAEYELVKNDLPNGTKVFFTDDASDTVVFMSKSMTSNAYGYFSGFEDKDGNIITRNNYVLFDITAEETGAYYFGMVFEVTGSGIIVKMANQNLQAVTESKTLTIKYSYIKR